MAHKCCNSHGLSLESRKLKNDIFCLTFRHLTIKSLFLYPRFTETFQNLLSLIQNDSYKPLTAYTMYVSNYAYTALSSSSILRCIFNLTCSNYFLSRCTNARFYASLNTCMLFDYLF